MLCEKCLQFEYVSFPIGKDTSVQGICALFYMGMGLGGHLTWVYVHCAISVTHLV